MSAMVSYYPAVQDQLNKAGDCAVCNQPFVSLWLDCVQFELPKKVQLGSRVINQLTDIYYYFGHSLQIMILPQCLYHYVALL